MNRFDIVEFKRKGPVAFTLGGLLKIFTPSWDFWGWHLAIAWQRGFDGWMLLESTGSGVGLNFHSTKELEQGTRVYHWFDATDAEKAKQFEKEYIGKDYDVAVYFWTALQYLVRHFWNRRIPRLLDDRFTCWELVSEFCDSQSKPVGSKYDCPMLPEIIKNIAGNRILA